MAALTKDDTVERQMAKLRETCVVPRATGGGNKDDTARHRAASVALCRSHCQAGIGPPEVDYFIAKICGFLRHVG